jgi:hypothetical protein
MTFEEKAAALFTSAIAADSALKGLECCATMHETEAREVAQNVAIVLGDAVDVALLSATHLHHFVVVGGVEAYAAHDARQWLRDVDSTTPLEDMRAWVDGYGLVYFGVWVRR